MRSAWQSTALAALALALAAHALPEPFSDSPAWRVDTPAALDLYMPVPESNPLTPEKVALGRRLFHDPLLSRDFTIACATCHDPRRNFSDSLPRAVGIAGQEINRHAPALLNRGYGRAFFWDGRAASLEEQALQPITNPKEFDSTLEIAVTRLRQHAEYPALFRAAFSRDVCAEDISRALASYVRTIVVAGSPADRYFAGDVSALSAQARDGLELFRGKANCVTCHAGPLFSDEQFHNTGVAWRDGAFADLGRGGVTGKKEDWGAFKTPSLREAARTAPYMHDGSLRTLEAVIEFYDRGGNANPQLDAEIRPLHLLPEEKKALLAFLHSLIGTLREGRLVPLR
ncbi:MAG TPA: cytochrome c peroxidase [Candidatus Nitrosotenuis sp.]|nr:cytochrome c peroxidase [Candidatus Nitrosotenuis sp.]